MDVVKRFIVPWTAGLLSVCSMTAWSTTVPSYCGTARWQPFIKEAASRFELPSRWLAAVIRAESAGCDFMDGRPTTSAAGAMGLMQLTPTTWELFKRRLNLGRDAYDPHDNIQAGAAYLRELFDRYGWPGSSAAYHAGPARYDDYLTTGRPLPRATLDYLARIDRSLTRMSVDSPLPSVAAEPAFGTDRELFVARKASVAVVDAHTDRTTTDRLFVALRHEKHPAKSKTPEPSDVQEK
jgi:soluble lytic murein transglycosylase-like protein